MICQSVSPSISCIKAGNYEKAADKNIHYGAHGGDRWHHCISSDILLFVLQDGARGEEGRHMVGIYQLVVARVIECELKVKLQTAERESRA